MIQKSMPRAGAAARNGRAVEPPRMRAMQSWVSVGTMRLTAGEWNLLHSLATLPQLQRASNATLELTRVGRQFSAVSTDIEELISKRLLMVDRAIRGGRLLYPTRAALAAVASVEAVDLLPHKEGCAGSVRHPTQPSPR